MKLARWFWWLLLVVMGLLVITTLVAITYMVRASPTHEGEMRLPGLQSEVSIERDQNGIPTIRAASTEDAAYALGVAHAQDRLWQLQTHLRLGSGRLAEAFGAAALDNDKFLRALGVKRAAAAQWANLKNPESRRVIEAYTAGVNEVIDHHTAARPPELVILGLPVEKWTPEDSLAWAIMMAWDLGGNWSTELLRLRLSLTLPVERVNQAIPPYPGEHPLATADYAAIFREMKLAGALASPQSAKTAQAPDLHWMDRLLAAAPPSGIEGVGSNNWVVAGSRSVTGKPLLANDPHLKITTPSLWYFARIEIGGVTPYKVAGATMPGLPGVVLGQNQHIAWGFTNTGPDVQDLYLEKLRPDDPNQVQTPTGWQALEVVQESIAVKGGLAVPFTARRSRHGPVLSDAGGGSGIVAGQSGHVIALRWTALDDDLDPITPNLAIQRATSADEFVQAASSGWVAPMQNMVVADKAGPQGHIAMVSAGRVPLRGTEHDLKGLVPALGWEAKYDWQGWLPHEQTPREVDPARGWIATANQRIHAADYPHFLTSEWALPYRQQRIEQVLAARPKHSLADMAALQADVKSLATTSILPWLQKARSDHRLAPAALKALQGFDGQMDADAAAPLIFNAWARQMARATFTDELGGPEVYENVVPARSFRDALDAIVTSGKTWWCDDKNTSGLESCETVASVALTRALDELQRRFGSDVSQWRWGQAHAARSEHRPFSKVKALVPFFELRTPTGGDSYTVNVSRVGLQPDPVTGELYLNEHAASLRALYDVADLKQSRVMLSSGQSGLPWSGNYSNFSKPWAAVQYVPLWVDGQSARAGGVLKLLPDKPAGG